MLSVSGSCAEALAAAEQRKAVIIFELILIRLN